MIFIPSMSLDWFLTNLTFFSTCPPNKFLSHQVKWAQSQKENLAVMGAAARLFPRKKQDSV